jgi:phosphatidylglycerophosphate synthase
MTTGLLLATTPADGSDPAALQPWGAGSILERLLAQLARLGVEDVHVVTRPAWERDMEGLPVEVHESSTPADDLRTIAEIAREGRDDLVVAHGDVVTHDAALASVVERDGTAVLTARSGDELVRERRGPPLGAGSQDRFAPRVRERRGCVVSAGSPYHSVRQPTGAFLGVMCVAAADRATLARIAEHLATLSPPAWHAAFQSRASGWPACQIAAARQDVISLLVTGLVRDRARVVGAPLQRLFWARPLSADAVAAAAERIEADDEDRLLLDSAVKSDDGFFTTFFVSPYSRFIARWAARRGLTPNQVTTASMLLGLVAAAAFATGDRWALIAGAVVLQISFTLDCVDGQLARYTRTFSPLGAWLDSIFDRAKEYAVFAGLAIGASQTGDDVWLLAGCALALQTVRHMILFGYRDAQERVADPPQPPIEQPSDELGATAAGDREPLGRLSRTPAVEWPRRMIPFPIGERFAVISVTAALFTPRTTFVVLLAWGGVAAAYTFSGRVLRSIG